VARAFAYRATGEERAKALYFDQMEHKVAAGLGRDGTSDLPEPGVPRRHPRRARLHQRDLGVATRPASRLPAVLDLHRRRVKNALNAKALVFSVKGEDLLFLDHTNRRLDRRPAGRLRDAQARGRAAFASVGFFAPPTPDDLSRAARTSSAAPAG
jgi:hypothetical protein